MTKIQKRNSLIAFLVGGIIGTVSLNGFNYYYLKQTSEPKTIIIDFILFGALAAFLVYVNGKKRNL